jgi:hypothetical protein
MPTFAEQMSYLATGGALNSGLISTFPDSIWFNGVSYQCIVLPLDIFQTINPQNYDAKVTFTFQIFESDRATAGMNIKDTVEFDSPYAAQFGKTKLAFQIAKFQPDKNDSMVRLICNLKQ